MCNIAGYIGSRDAAPILINMIREQEGLNGGFYTGIATLHEGKIHYRKVVGDLSELLKRTDAASLPGNIGIIHSRTPGFAGDEWSHPFVHEQNGEVFSALVLNGSIGCFKPLDQKRIEVAEQLLSEGFDMKTQLGADYKVTSVLQKPGAAVFLGDGSRVHPSDITCQLTAKFMLEGLSAPKALTRCMSEIPKEVVVLMLSLNEPEAISWTRVNQPMHLAYADHGAYLATAPQAIPDDAGEYILLPVQSSGLVKRDGFTVEPYKKAPARIAPLTPRVRRDVYETIVCALKTEKHTLSSLTKLAKPLFDEADCVQGTASVYPVLCDLKKRGILKIEKGSRQGVFEGLSAPVDYLYIE